VGAGTALRRHGEHARPEHGQDARPDGHSTLIEDVEVARHGIERAHPLRGGFAVAGSDAEQQPPGMPGLDAVVGVGEFIRVGLPDVDDAGRDVQRPRGVEQFLRGPEVGVRRAALPDGSVAEVLDGPGHGRADVVDVAPHTDGAESLAPAHAIASLR
jgi:hypothetical protein